MKTIFALIIAMAVMVASAHARIEIEDRDGPCPSDCPSCGARWVEFWDDSNPNALAPYYYYIIRCDGSVTESWLGQIVGIGTIPTWASQPWVITGSVNSSGVWVDQVYSNGHLAAEITFDQVSGHHATVTTYDPPIE